MKKLEMIENAIKLLVVTSLVIIVLAACMKASEREYKQNIPSILTPTATATALSKVKQTEAPNSSDGLDKIIKISATKLSSEYKNNEVQADHNYQDEMMLVNGIIYEITVDQGSTYIKLEGSEFDQISCKMQDSENEKIMELKKGKKVVIQGLCIGFDELDFYPSLEECKLK